MRVKSKAIITKRNALSQPDTDKWPRIDPTLVRMECGENGMFSFVQSP